MEHQDISLLNLSRNKKAKITMIHGGHGLQHRLNSMGIRNGKEIKVVSKQPFRGPLTVEVCGCQMTLGRGMARKIMVDVFL
jgi:ferrous iron transport protein A